jgi:hypothetical protein
MEIKYLHAILCSRTGFNKMNLTTTNVDWPRYLAKRLFNEVPGSFGMSRYFHKNEIYEQTVNEGNERFLIDWLFQDFQNKEPVL